MTMRTSAETVTFRHPFTLSAVDGTQPAGAYLVETDEELLPTLSAPAYRRLSTLIHLMGSPHSNEISRIVDIDPIELAEARASDARAERVPTSIGPVAPCIHGEQRRTKEFVLERWTRWLFSTPAN